MIKTTPKQISESMDAVNALLGAKLPAKAAYSVSRLARACQSEMETFTKARQKIFIDAGCTEKDKKYVHQDPAKLDAAVKESEELAGVEVELNALVLDLDQFNDADVPGNAFYALDWAMKPADATGA